jgi:type I site-specific restriction endonuclease
VSGRNMQSSDSLIHSFKYILLLIVIINEDCDRALVFCSTEHHHAELVRQTFVTKYPRS